MKDYYMRKAVTIVPEKPLTFHKNKLNKWSILSLSGGDETKVKTKGTNKWSDISLIETNNLADLEKYHNSVMKYLFILQGKRKTDLFVVLNDLREKIEHEMSLFVVRHDASSNFHNK